MDDGHMAMVLSEAFGPGIRENNHRKPGQQNSIYTSICQQKCWWTPGQTYDFLLYVPRKSFGDQVDW